MISDTHVITVAHCFKTGESLVDETEGKVIAKTKPSDAYRSIRVDLYRDGDLAVVTFPPDTFKAITPANSGFKPLKSRKG